MQMHVFAYYNCIVSKCKGSPMSKKSMTSARIIILDILDQNPGHLSAKEIYEAARKQLPAINLSTVYRTLEFLVEENTISVTDMGGGVLVYETASAGIHHHLVCQHCGAITNLDHESQVRPFFEQIQSQKGFDILTNHLVLWGICADCQRRH